MVKSYSNPPVDYGQGAMVGKASAVISVSIAVLGGFFRQFACKN